MKDLDVPDVERPDGPRTKREKAASARALEAQAELFEAQARLYIADAEEAEAHHVASEMLREINRDKHEEYRATDNEHRTYRFLGVVTQATAKTAVDKLVQWHRVDPECNIKFVIDSPGGGIIEGFHLFDQMLWLRREGHHITTIATGMAASMGGVLFQAGSERIMTPQASMLIHEAQFGTGGSFGQVEDEVEYVRMLQDRILYILAERSTLSRLQIKRKWSRKNWWLMAEEAVKLGFADSIE